jgi:outer membrane immunogenic protein
VGGNIGYGWQRTSTTDVDPFDAGHPDDVGSGTGSGVVGGGQVGCDYQFAGNWVVGIQGMFDGAGVNESHIVPFSYSGDTTEYHSAKADWFGTLTARLGYAVSPDTLLYVKGGGAWVHDTFTNADPSGTFYPPFSGQATTTRTGWTIGGGGEYKFSVNWSVFATVLVGLNYRFGGPVVAKY